MSDEAETGGEAAAAEQPRYSSIEEFMEARMASDGDDEDGGTDGDDGGDHEAQGSSEQDDGGEGGGEDGDEVEAHSDEEGDTEQEQAPPPERVARIVKKLKQREQELSDERKARRQLEEEKKTWSAPRPKGDPTDRVGRLRNTLAEDMGLSADDPKVNDALAEALQEFVEDSYGDSDPIISERRNQRKQQAEVTRKQRELQEQLDRLELEKVQASQQTMRVRAVSAISEHVRESKVAERYPYLTAAQGADTAALIYDGLLSMIADGHDLSSDAAANAAFEQLAQRADYMYQQEALRYEPILSRKQLKAQPNKTDARRSETGKQSPVKPGKKQGYTTTDAGSGTGRGTPGTASKRLPGETIDEFIERREAEDADAARRRGGRRPS